MIPKKWLWITLAIIAASALAEILFHFAHGEYWWQNMAGFDFAYGVLGCMAIVLGSKWLGEAFLQRKAGYYEEHS